MRREAQVTRLTLVRRRKRLNLEPLSKALEGVTDLKLPSFVVPAPVSPRDWEAAVGTRIAARARPVRLDRGVLIVKTATSTWAQELTMLAEEILPKLRERGLAVDALRFRVGPVDPPARPATREEVRASPPKVPLPPAVAMAVSEVEDRELRAIIAEAAARNLGWQLTARPASRREMAPPTPGPEVEPPATSARPGARAPRSAAPENAPPDRTRWPARGARRDKP